MFSGLLLLLLLSLFFFFFFFFFFVSVAMLGKTVGLFRCPCTDADAPPATSFWVVLEGYPARRDPGPGGYPAAAKGSEKQRMSQVLVVGPPKSNECLRLWGGPVPKT